MLLCAARYRTICSPIHDTGWIAEGYRLSCICYGFGDGTLHSAKDLDTRIRWCRSRTHDANDVDYQVNVDGCRILAKGYQQ